MRKYLLGFGVFALAFLILSVSVLRSASPRYAFSSRSPSPKTDKAKSLPQAEIDYILPYPGKILPDSPFWPAKALRDRFWRLLTVKASKKAELSLLYANKRLVMSRMLFEREKPELAFSTLAKGEKYLEAAFEGEEKARHQGENTTELLIEIANASLKHRQMIDEILTLAPEDAKPEIIKVQNYSKNIYEKAAEALNAKGISAPINPFAGNN